MNNTVGWIALGLIVGIVAVTWIEFRRKKNRTRKNPSHHIISLDGFPVVHVPTTVTREVAIEVAETLHDAVALTWAKLEEVYSATPGPLPINTIGMTVDECLPDHPYVYWIAPGDKIVLRYQDGYEYWFSAELHNVFRYMIHGIDHIYKPVNTEDLDNAVLAADWIRFVYEEAVTS